jgi:UDPglucose 6-dehydrogenase
MKIAVIGTGYVGLVSGTCFAEIGHDVICVDISEAKIAALKEGVSPIYEPGLDEMIVANAAHGRLRFTTDLASAVTGADAVFIAVGTPSRAEDGEADLSYVHAAARDIARNARGMTVVVAKSTVPVGTGDALERTLREANPFADIRLVSNPEFLREGVAIGDFMHPDRIVIGTEDEEARAVMSAIYAPLDAPLVFVTRRTSELIKYAANSFLSVKISFINEIANLCEVAGADVQDVARGIGLDSRIGSKFLNAGPGYGGSCFPKDTRALVETARHFGTPLQLVEATVRINDERKKAMAGKIAAACGGSVAGKTIAILGLTFKPGTDDMREAPSIDIIEALQAAGAGIRAFEPSGSEHAAELVRDVTFCEDAYDAAKGASAVVIVTEWDDFRDLDFARLAALVAEPNLVDLRNLYMAEGVGAYGFSYTGIGRPAVAAPAADSVPAKAGAR